MGEKLRIIDAHLHFEQRDYFDEIARASGHENTEAHLRGEYARLGIEQGIVMGNKPAAQTDCAYPDCFHYCVGIDHDFQLGDTEKLAEFAAAHLAKPACVGIKLYPGYNYFYLYDDRLKPLYEVAEKYAKPVAVHTGLLATGQGILKYSHPIVMDEAATKFPRVQFVMCHFGEPYFQDAAAVVENNVNVAADLSGMLEGKIQHFPAFRRKKQWYIEMLRGWLEYLDLYDRLMFGTDWPLANLGDYIDFTKEIIPEEHWEKVFFDNANRIYQLNL